MQTYKSHVSQGGFDFRNGSEPYFPAKGVHTHDLVLERVRWILDRRKQSSCGGPDDGPTCHEGSTAPLFLMLALQSPHCPLDEVPERYLLPYREHFRELLANESVVRFDQCLDVFPLISRAPTNLFQREYLVTRACARFYSIVPLSQ